MRVATCLINPFHWVSLKEVLQRVIWSLAFVYRSCVLHALPCLSRRDCVPNVKSPVYVNVPANFHSVSSHRSKPNRGSRCFRNKLISGRQNCVMWRERGSRRWGLIKRAVRADQWAKRWTLAVTLCNSPRLVLL